MALNIKNDETQRLARELVAITGESVTTAVTVAIRERLEKVRAAPRELTHDERVERIMELARDIAPRLSPEFMHRDHGDILYDEKGLPA